MTPTLPPTVRSIEPTPVAFPARRRRRTNAGAAFTTIELRRVAAAATLNISGIIAVVLLLLPIVGYNSTAQALPKSLLDGAVIAMLVGSRGRWRLLGLFGVVVGLFLAFVIPAIPPLLGIYALAGAAAMCVGYGVDRLSRRLAVAISAGVFAILAGAGIAVQIYFASRDGREPFLWTLVAVEIALRSIGAPLGTLIGWRCLTRLNASASSSLASAAIASRTLGRRVRMEVSPAYTLVILGAASAACTVPMFVERLWLLAALAAAYAAIAVAVNQARSILSVALVMVWGWMFYGAASWFWHHDIARVADFGRSLVLRFFPMATIALVMIRTVRPVAVVRLLRHARVSGAILLPLSIVLRAVPNARREIVAGVEQMKADGAWDGRLTPVTHPIRVTRYTIAPLVKRWGATLAEV